MKLDDIHYTYESIDSTNDSPHPEKTSTITENRWAILPSDFKDFLEQLRNSHNSMSLSDEQIFLLIKFLTFLRQVLRKKEQYKAPADFFSYIKFLYPLYIRNL